MPPKPAVLTHAAPGGIPDAITLPAALADDPLLDSKVTLLRRDVPVQEALRELTRQTGVSLTATDSGSATAMIVVAVKDVPLRDVLLALAAVFDDHWKPVAAPPGQGRDATTPRQVGLALMSLADDPRAWDFYRPHSQAQADERRAILGVAGAVARLSADVRQALGTEPLVGRFDQIGVPYANLPPDLQQAIQGFLEAGRDDLHTGLSPDNLGAARVCFQSKHNDWATDYTLHVCDQAGHGVAAGFQRPSDPRAQDLTPLPDGYVPWQRRHDPAVLAAYNAARVRAADGDPRLAQSVSLRSDFASVGYPLTALSEAAHVPIIAQGLPTLHTVALGPVPLREALDQIAAKYRGSWTVTSGGVVVFHDLARKQPGFLTPAEVSANEATADAVMHEQQRNLLIRLAPPDSPLFMDGVPVSRDAPPDPTAGP